jgi:hypothetical protein
MRKLNIFIQIGLVVAFLTGCSTKFIYKSPEIKPPELTGIAFVYAKVEDRREDRKIDEVYENKEPLQDIIRIIEEEVKSTGLFERVLLISEDKMNNDAYLKENNIAFLMTSFLKEFRWTVPNYDTKVGIIFATTLFGGVMGGLIYGSFFTDVYGDTVLNVTMKDISSGRLLIDKEYVGHCTERKAILSCDSPEMKATVAGSSLKMVMEEFKADLIEAVKSKTIKEK